MCISLLSIEIKKKYFQKDPRLEVASLSLQTETLHFISWKKEKKWRFYERAPSFVGV